MSSVCCVLLTFQYSTASIHIAFFVGVPTYPCGLYKNQPHYHYHVVSMFWCSFFLAIGFLRFSAGAAEDMETVETWDRAGETSLLVEACEELALGDLDLEASSDAASCEAASSWGGGVYGGDGEGDAAFLPLRLPLSLEDGCFFLGVCFLPPLDFGIFEMLT